MISKEIIEQLAAEELVDANAKHEPKFNSPHEAYAVIKEELEEAETEMRECNNRLAMMWGCVKNDDDENVRKNLEYMKKYAVKTVQELIQVIAMCDKALMIDETKLP